MKRFFITSTGTGIGKTFVTAALTHHARSAGMAVRVAKPVISGFSTATRGDSDTAILLESAGIALTEQSIAACSSWRFEAPLSPDMAAAREGRSIDFAALVGWSREFFAAQADLTLMEGVGGVMVPLNATHTIRDLIAALDIPVILVAGSYLGTLSHTLTALAALGSMKCTVVISESPESPVPPEESAAVLARFTQAKLVVLPRAGDWRQSGADLLATLLA